MVPSAEPLCWSLRVPAAFITPPLARAGNSVLGQQRQHFIYLILSLLTCSVTASWCISQMKYNIWLKRELSIPYSACSRALEPSSSFSAFASLKLCHCFHAGASPVNLFQDLFHIGRKYLYQNTRNLSCVLCLSTLRLIYKANGLIQCHTIIKKLYICKSLGTFEKFPPFQPPLTPQNFRHNYG